MRAVAIDTNVPVTANGRAEQAGGACVERCIDRLTALRGRELILLDSLGLILQEYLENLSLRGQPGPGDAFFKWVWDNQANHDVCRQVRLTPIDDEGFEEFPQDPKLKGFHRKDRKFAAVALNHREPATVINASDTDWWIHRQALTEHGIEVEFVCPELMREK